MNSSKTNAGRALGAMPFNSSRFHRERMNRAAALTVPANSLVLDAGAGNCPYKELIGQAQYESADFGQAGKKYGEITYVCDLRDPGSGPTGSVSKTRNVD